MDFIKVWPQYILPHHALSRVMHRLTRTQSHALNQWVIKRFIQHYQVDMSLAKNSNQADYKTINAFFTRELKPESRPVDSDSGCIVSPVDGVISQSGHIHDGVIIQAKKHDYRVADLLVSDTYLKQFDHGRFATIYLSPKDYHRIHMPCDGELLKVVYVPGRLFAVNPATARNVNRLFARNERVICYFQTAYGVMAMVMVGAIFVGSIETIWQGEITPPHRSQIQTWPTSGVADKKALALMKGCEMGRFNMGSTVIILFENNKMAWNSDIEAGKNVKIGARIGGSI